MQRLINFVIKSKTFLLFIFLFVVAIALTIQSHSYHRSQYFNSTNFIVGSIYAVKNNINAYLGLKTQNKILTEENRTLRSLLLHYTSSDDSTYIDSTSYPSHFKITSAKVYKNSYSTHNNYITINKGQQDAIYEESGVITPKGILGIIDTRSKNYSRVISILNKKISVNVRLKNSYHFGSLVWDAQSPLYMQLRDISRFAPVKVNDTIVTGGQSAIFPEGIPIGSIDNFNIDNTGDSYIISVKLFNDMTSIKDVYVLENIDKKEIQSLEINADVE